VVEPVARADAAIATCWARSRSPHLAKILPHRRRGCGPAIDRKLLDVHAASPTTSPASFDQAVAEGGIAPVDTRLAALGVARRANEIIRRWPTPESLTSTWAAPAPRAPAARHRRKPPPKEA